MKNSRVRPLLTKATGSYSYAFIHATAIEIEFIIFQFIERVVEVEPAM